MWQEKKAEDMTLEEAREAVKTLRRVLMLRLTEPVSDNKLKDDWKPTFTKPPLGCKPAYISSSKRIKELSEAIARQPDNSELVKKWAVEILYQCEILKNVK